MKTTLDDIARACGVSKATASYVINGKQSSFKLSAATVRRVLEECRLRNYRPDLLAQALGEQKRSVLSIVILSPWLHSQFSDFMVQVGAAVQSGMETGKVRADYVLYRSGELKRILNSAKCRKYDAVIVIGTNGTDDAFLDRSRQLFPNVILLNRMREGYLGSFGNDEAVCAEMAKRLAAGKHYDRFVLLRGVSVSRREEFRISGYRKVLARPGRDRFLERSLDDAWHEPERLEEILKMRKGRERVCFLCTQYITAARLLNHAIRSGRNVPEDVGIVGFDRHSLLDDFLRPALTTIDPKIFEMTKQALSLARAMKDGEKAESCVTKAVIGPGGSAILA